MKVKKKRVGDTRPVALTVEDLGTDGIRPDMRVLDPSLTPVALKKKDLGLPGPMQTGERFTHEPLDKGKLGLPARGGNQPDVKPPLKKEPLEKGATGIGGIRRNKRKVA